MWCRSSTPPIRRNNRRKPYQLLPEPGRDHAPTASGFEPYPVESQGARFVSEEASRWAPVIKALGLQPEAGAAVQRWVQRQSWVATRATVDLPGDWTRLGIDQYRIIRYSFITNGCGPGQSTSA